MRADRTVAVAACDGGHDLLVVCQRGGEVARVARETAGEDVSVLKCQRAAHPREKRRAVGSVTDEGAAALRDARHHDLGDGVGEGEIVRAEVTQDALHFVGKAGARREEVGSHGQRIVMRWSACARPDIHHG